MKRLELLSPAKDIATGFIAINNGADAVYIGAPAFGARKAASNSIEDIRTLIEYAHRYYCKVFITLNTILYDSELSEAEKMIRRLYEIDADALIIQDLGILKMDIPPIALHASTQMHNYDIERIKFLDRIGFRRIVLARELSLEQIRKIRVAVKAELEVFVHGALCVSFSGQCYLSHFLSGRSANRGECAQPCRMKWSLKDSSGKLILKDKYLLSLKDSNLSAHIKDLIDAGVDSFKIEGRLKNQDYVANVTQYYNNLINSIEPDNRVSSGKIISDFTPAPEKSFNRFFTDYFISGRQKGLVNMNSPKSVGQFVGIVTRTKDNVIESSLSEKISNGDGLVYFYSGELQGIRVNRVEGNHLFCFEDVNIPKGTKLYRNFDIDFRKRLEQSHTERKIFVDIEFNVADEEINICITDEDGNKVDKRLANTFDKARNVQQKDRITEQLSKWGGTEFACNSVIYTGEVLFISSSQVNEMRRELLTALREKRERNRPRSEHTFSDKSMVYPLAADWKCNITNRKSADFYREHGKEPEAYGLEVSGDFADKELMRTKYCILYELGRCKQQHDNKDIKFPLFLFGVNKSFRLDFDCSKCEMTVNTDK
ncbi:MAG: U32 family peptidase [Culturomica sp.]|jgi:putative protease|nr:U32 family peptidase [Culturomica sp.]